MARSVSATRLLAYAWAFPTTAIGLLLVAAAAVSGARVSRVDGVLEAHGGLLVPLLKRGVPLRGGASAMTLGHVVVGRDAGALERTRAHERAHVRQTERWGALFVPVYALASLHAAARGGHYYRDNTFERDAVAAASNAGRTVAILLLAVVLALPVSARASDPELLYHARHPGLLFNTSDLPGLRAKVQDGGADDLAYAAIYDRVYSYYATAPYDSLIENDYALEPVVNIGLCAWMAEPVDSLALQLGRDLTLHIARTWNVDTDAYGSSLRLRSLALGYDLFFGPATPAERAEVRAEMEAYLAYMTTNLNYDIWTRRPYVSNKSAMVAAAMGLAGISLGDETTELIRNQALTRAEITYNAWRDAHLVGDGSYSEGTLYAGWSLRNLIYYFEARRRYDGYNYGDDASIRAIERWFPYELDPRGNARLNNLGDQTDYFRPLARHTTYWSWAQAAWGSSIAAYVYEHAAGQYGYDIGDESDKAACVLWSRPVIPHNPAQHLPLSGLWLDRGLYYFRTGWPDASASEDVVFSFYSGPFRGGHAQEDQNQFTLTAYGERLIVDHGSGSTARQSEAHNIIRIDGQGQHNAGGSIGTDGAIVSSVVTGFADVVVGDATSAYSTHSEYNNAGVPYPWSNWSWGLYGANPVLKAHRQVIAIRDGNETPYFVVRDDIQKDAAVRRYDWCAHAPQDAVLDLSDPEAIHVARGNAVLDIHAVHPARASLVASSYNFNNYSEDPDSRALMLTSYAANPGFALALIPRRADGVAPVSAYSADAQASRLTLTWPNGFTDLVVARTPLMEATMISAGESPGLAGCTGELQTDAVLGVVRSVSAGVTGYALVDMTLLTCGGEEIVRIDDGPATVVYDGTTVSVSRPEANFRVRAEGVTEILHNGVHVPAVLIEGYWTNAIVTGASPLAPNARLALRAFPNPFNPSVRIAFFNPTRGPVHADIHDAAGRRVATLVTGVAAAGEQQLVWDGRDSAGEGAASGVYFLRVRAGQHTESIKLVLLR